MTREIAVLFARRDSVYKQMLGCDVWDKDRDATHWPGGCSVVAHPPCRAWCRLRMFAKPEIGEKELALFAVEQVRHWGGVLEHPAFSSLWNVAGLPRRLERDCYGGWTLAVPQFWWGHRAAKPTWLYIVGVEPSELPEIPLVLGEPSHVVSTRKRVGHRPHLHKAEREKTPPAFAAFLCEVARRVLPVRR